MKGTNNKEHTILLKKYPMSQVNLDALIPREDLEIKETKLNTPKASDISITHLKRGELFRESLRKPEFQRGTWEWSPEKVYNLIKSFTNGDLIPAVILWRGEGNNFVIDGAHRLSALIAWVDNDYGFGGMSISFFGTELTDDQQAKAKETKKLIEENIGSYDDIMWAAQNPEKALPHRLTIAKNLSALSIVLQWVPGDASQAENSFFKINEAASPIDATEKRLLKARNKPCAVASRAIVRAGSGHKYWSGFSLENQNKIEEVAKEINDWLFKPKLETPIKTMDISLAGKSYSNQTQELILNIVNFSNNIKIVDASRIRRSQDFPEQSIADDLTSGLETLEYLRKTKSTLSIITSKLSSSLGLHPVIYCYSKIGRYQITSFMAALYLFIDYDKKNKLESFTEIRKEFEEFIWKHKILVNQATTNWGSGAKGYVNLSKLFDYIIQQLLDNKTEKDILSLLDTHVDYNFFKPNVKELNPKHQKDFSSETKSEVFMREGVANALRCNICGGYLHKNSIQIDHDEEKENGGIGNAENGKLVHPYCNSIKKKLKANGFVFKGLSPSISV